MPHVFPSTRKILAAARRWLEEQRAKGGRATPYLDRWAGILSRDVPDIQEAIVDPGEEARALRQCSPFAGLLPAAERFRIWREVRERFEASV